MEATGGFGVDALIEALGPNASVSTVLDSFNALRRGGKAINIGGVAEPIPLEPFPLMCLQKSYIGSLWFTAAEGEDMAAMAMPAPWTWAFRARALPPTRSTKPSTRSTSAAAVHQRRDHALMAGLRASARLAQQTSGDNHVHSTRHHRHSPTGCRFRSRHRSTAKPRVNTFPASSPRCFGDPTSQPCPCHRSIPRNPPSRGCRNPVGLI